MCVCAHTCTYCVLCMLCKALSSVLIQITVGQDSERGSVCVCVLAVCVLGECACVFQISITSSIVLSHCV